jgi:hypothetical protein
MIQRALSLVLLLAGCEIGVSSAPQPSVSVLKRDGDCFALMTAGTPVAPALGVHGVCGYRADPRVLAGIDLVQLVIDYGAEVTFEGTVAAPPPTITITVDGLISDQPIELSPEQRAGGRAYFIATFRAPRTPSANMRVEVGVNPGFHTLVPDVFAVVAPRVELALVDCPLGIDCAYEGAVGAANVYIAVLGEVPQVVKLRSALDGVAQPDPVPPLVTQVFGGHTAGTSAIPVPTAPEGTLWTITAQIGDAPPSAVTATIHAPAIAAQLSCGPTCALDRDEPVGLEITAPAAIQQRQALVTTRLDGVPQLVAAPVTLVALTDGAATGLLGLRAPTSPGTWQIDVSVAGYLAPAVVTTIP